MANSVFREKSLQRISSPEELDRYIRVSNPSVWIVLSAILVLLTGFIIWGIFGRLETVVSVNGTVENGEMVAVLPYDDLNSAKVKQDMFVYMDDNQVGKVSNVSVNPNGERVARFSTTKLADGKYTLGVMVESINLMYFIFN